MKVKVILISIVTFLINFNLFAQEVPPGGIPIYTAEDLQNMNQNLSSDYYLMNDIDCSSIPNFIPVGDLSGPFSGSLEGNNYTISNLNISHPNNQFVGLFALAFDSTIKNLHLKNVMVEGREFVGGLVGYLAGSVVENCSISKHEQDPGLFFIKGDNQVGGLIGNISNSTIYNSFTSINVEGRLTVGGFVGGTQNQSQIDNCYSLGNVSGIITQNGEPRDTGGFVGNNFESYIRTSYAKGDCIGDGIVGGFAGRNSTNGHITECYSINTQVSGNQMVGGFVGLNNFYIYRSFTESKVTGNDAGGFAGADFGDNTSYFNCYWYSQIAVLPQNQDIGSLGDHTDIEDKVEKQEIHIEITSPVNNAYVHDNMATIYGEIQVPDFHHYELYYALKSDPTQRTFIMDSFGVYPDNELGTWDTTGLNDGEYLLILVVHTSQPINPYEVETTVTLDLVNDMPVFKTLSNQGVLMYQPLKFKVEAYDQDDPSTPQGNLVYSAYSNTLQIENYFDPVTREFNIQGGLVEEQTHNITFYVSDDQYTEQQTITLEVYPNNLQSILMNENFVYDSLDIDNDYLTYIEKDPTKILRPTFGNAYLMNYKTNSTIPLNTNGYDNTNVVEINLPYVAWVEDADIYLLNVETQEKIIIQDNPSVIGQNPDNYNTPYNLFFDNERLFWCYNFHIFYYNIMTQEIVQIQSPYSASQFDVEQDSLLWIAGYENLQNVFKKNLITGSETHIAPALKRQYNPLINDGKIIWYSKASNGLKYQLYLQDYSYSHEDRVLLTESTTFDNIKFENGRIAWVDKSLTLESKLKVYDITKQELIHFPKYDLSGYEDIIYSPNINGKKVIWSTRGSAPLQSCIKIYNFNKPPVFDNFSDTYEINVTEEFNKYFRATDPDEEGLNYRLEMLDGSPLPDGVNINEFSGYFTWIPTTFGEHSFIIYASDEETEIEKTITINVNNRAPVFNPIGNKVVNEGETLEFTVSALDPDGHDVNIVELNLPDGATFNSVTKTFSWTPSYDQAGTYAEIGFKVYDTVPYPYGLSSETNITITVNNVNRAPVFNPIGNKVVNEGETLQFNVSAIDSDGDQVTITASNLPNGATFENGVFTWTPIYDQEGIYSNVTFTVTDGNLVTNEVITITVNNSTNWIQLTYDDFENGWGNFKDGGGDCFWYKGSYAHQGIRAANIQDNSGSSSSFYYHSGKDIKTLGYTEIKINFWFYAVSMENKEDFWVQYYDGSSWKTIKKFVRGIDFGNKSYYNKTVTISESDYNFPTNMKIRFRCDATANADDVYIDEVEVSVR